jgi:hypothetical protein
VAERFSRVEYRRAMRLQHDGSDLAAVVVGIDENRQTSQRGPSPGRLP